MRNNITGIKATGIKAIGFLLALVAGSANAVPTLLFDGTISFDSSSRILSVTSSLTSTIDIASNPDVAGSSFAFSARLDSVDPATTYTQSYYGSMGNDLSVTDGNGNLLLTSDFSNLFMVGSSDRNDGMMLGILQSTGGMLEGFYDLGNLVAMEFNLSTPFNATMFDSDFSGNINGSLIGRSNPTLTATLGSVAVPEPAIVAILGIGLLLIGLGQIRIKRH